MGLVMTPKQVTDLTPLIRRVISDVDLGRTNTADAARQLEVLARSHGVRPGDVILHLARQTSRGAARSES
jgi:hypothetical protein